MLSLVEKHLLSVYSVPESAASQGTDSEQPVLRTAPDCSGIVTDTHPAAIGWTPLGSGAGWGQVSSEEHASWVEVPGP